jgi:hypothetical protein
MILSRRSSFSEFSQIVGEILSKHERVFLRRRGTRRRRSYL